MLDKVKQFLGLSNRKTGNQIVISCEKLERRVALLEDGVLEEYNLERDTDRNIVGSIFKGKVKNIEHGLKAMFVDIGFEKNAFLHFWDALPGLDSSVEEVNRAAERKSKKKITAKDVPEIYPVGSEVMVQVTKGPISNKGPRITTNISLAGRYLVLMPHSDQSGISRKIEDPKERERLRTILQRLDIPEGMGVIIRTIGEGQRARYFVRDLGLLIEQWRQIEDAFKTRPAPAVLFQEPDLVDRTVRDFLTEEINVVYCDDEVAVERMQNLVGQISKRSKKRIFLYNESVPIFDKFDVQKQIDDAFHRQVWLKCGGYIVIDETEALIAIDVNTGRNKGARDVEKTILQTNLEAADEIARQLRLRNIGGLIISDFIDMKNRKDQQLVYNRMKERLKRDKAKTHVLPISAAGIDGDDPATRTRELDRVNVHHLSLLQRSSGCQKPDDHERRNPKGLHAVMRQKPDVHDIRVIVNPEVLNRLKTEDEELLVDIERKYSGRLTFRTDPTYHHEKFVILDGANNQELKA